MDAYLKRKTPPTEDDHATAKKLQYELPTVVRVTHANKDDSDLVYIGREWKKGGYDFEQSKWHNPFFLKKDATPAERQKCLDEFRSHMKSKYGSGKYLMRALPELAGKKLGCWCKPLACHGDVLVELLREYVPPPEKLPLFRMVGTRAAFRLEVDFETVGSAKPFDPANKMHANAFEEDALESHVVDKILNVKWLFAPRNPTFSWTSGDDLDVECDLPPPPDGAKKLEEEIKVLKFMSYEKGSYMYDMRRKRDGKVVTVEIHIVGKRM